MAAKPKADRQKEIYSGYSAADYLAGDVANSIDPRALQVYRERNEAHTVAANDYVNRAEAWADEWTEDGPIWLGHALHRAFLAGAAWERVRQWAKEQNEPAG